MPILQRAWKGAFGPRGTAAVAGFFSSRFSTSGGTGRRWRLLPRTWRTRKIRAEPRKKHADSFWRRFGGGNVWQQEPSMGLSSLLHTEFMRTMAPWQEDHTGWWTRVTLQDKRQQKLNFNHWTEQSNANKTSLINRKPAYHIHSALGQVQAVAWLGDSFYCSLARSGQQLDPGPAVTLAAVEHIHCCFIVQLKLLVGDHSPVVTQHILIYRV